MQTKLQSLLESLSNIAIGLLINTGAQYLLYPLWDIHITVWENFSIAMVFTFISLVRSYTIRRFCDSRLNHNPH